MPRKTLALISGLVLVTVVLFVVAFKASKQQVPQVPQVAPTPVVVKPSPMTPAHTTLSFASEAVSVAPGRQGKVDIVIDTSDNAVTAVQLELQYDPMAVGNVQVSAGPLFENPVFLINKNDVKIGRVTYAFAILPNHPTVQGTGVVATVTFTAKGAVGTQSPITLLDKLPEDPTKDATMVTARGVADSVLKPGSVPAKVTVTLGQGSGDTMMKQEATQSTTKSY